MAVTLSFNITDQAWTNISESNTTGFFTNRGDGTILFRQDLNASPPASTVTIGHRLNPADDAVNFTITASERVSCRALLGNSLVVVTS